MSGDRLEDLRRRLEDIAEELADLAIDRLRDALAQEEAGGDPGGRRAADDERRLSRARRAVERAAGILADGES